MILAEGIVYPAGGGVLAGLSLRVGEGECLGILGDNGSGKTLLLEILATIRRPYAGGLFLQGRDALRFPETVRSSVGFVPEEIPTMAGVSVAEYLGLFARCYGMEPSVARDGEPPGDSSETGVGRGPVLAVDRALPGGPEAGFHRPERPPSPEGPDPRYPPFRTG
ncbi:MAG: ATP-binding cassette domain-containing protein [Chitinivibrionia bacterium]|nr:ATP-binding cassette domain-containing protein [Chitinivibrionia bacterium]